MTAAHFIYIPGILILGIVIGFILGGRAAESAKRENVDRAQRREARRARREQGAPREP